MRRLTLAIFFLLFSLSLNGAIAYSNRYRSPRNPERGIRKTTTLIVLHTTEAGAKSSLNKLSERGEAHYCVVENGMVYRIVDKEREAFHAGRSMWNGKEDCDEYTIGIEVVGHHDQPITAAQVKALKELLIELKKTYKLSDDKVVTHSQVAYGAPNKWQKKRHRGRKRCGMLFAMPSVRAALGLKLRMAADPDVKAKRLVVADKYLESVLYGKSDTMIGRVKSAEKAKPKTSIIADVKNLIGGNAKQNATNAVDKVSTTQKTPHVISCKPQQSIVAASNSKEGAKSTVAANAKTPTTKADLDKLTGYQVGGPVRKDLSAVKIAGKKWRAADTYYLMGKKVVPGNQVDEKHIVPGTMIYFRK